MKSIATFMMLFVLGLGAIARAEEKSVTDKMVVKVGDKAPDFELKTVDNKEVKLSDRFGKKGHPVILLFSRAHW